jgi:hypothetical protein
MSSRRVALTAGFLALAAGGTAACDSPEPQVVEYDTVTTTGDVYAEPDADEDEDVPPDEVFYCADEDGVVVEEENCDSAVAPPGVFLIWHSPFYSTSLTPGMMLDADGESFAPRDRAARRAFQLPRTGPVVNGTIKTGVVGKSGGSGSSGG